MKEQIVFLLIGGIVGYVGALLQHTLESKRQRASEIRLEKMRIYSNVLTELGGLFIDSENLINDLSNPTYNLKFELRLGRILAPARLIASNKLEEKLRELYDKEVEWHKDLSSRKKKENEDKTDTLGNEATKVRMEVEKEMRNELRN